MDVDHLPPTQYLILEVLAARYRTGEPCWTFPNRVRPAVEALSAAGLVNWKSSPAPGCVQVWFTDAGRSAAIAADYVPPRDRGPIRVVVVLNRVRGTVHGLTTDDEEAQEWVRELIAKHEGDQLAATMTVGLVSKPRKEG